MLVGRAQNPRKNKSAPKFRRYFYAFHGRRPTNEIRKTAANALHETRIPGSLVFRKNFLGKIRFTVYVSTTFTAQGRHLYRFAMMTDCLAASSDRAEPETAAIIHEMNSFSMPPGPLPQEFCGNNRNFKTKCTE
jgi:hypothetical protein